MRLFIICLLLSIAGTFLITQQPAVSQTEAKAQDGMLVHITAGPDEPHRLLMALQMARMMSDTNPVLVYMDIDAVKAVLKDSKDVTHPAFPTAQTQIRYLADHGVTIMACPGCLRAFGKTGDDLMAGVNVAQKDTFFDFAPGRIVTLDY
jgi:predicted peroxiredoxin